MRFYRRENFTYLQFIPAMGFQATKPKKLPAYLISPEAYGRFLVDIFDEWYENVDYDVDCYEYVVTINDQNKDYRV